MVVAKENVISPIKTIKKGCTSRQSYQSIHIGMAFQKVRKHFDKRLVLRSSQGWSRPKVQEYKPQVLDQVKQMQVLVGQSWAPLLDKREAG